VSAPRPVPGPPLRRLEAPIVVPPTLLASLPGPVVPELLVTYWNHPCPSTGCVTWVPNHRRGCAQHGEA
jgi:hypothetical protein